MQPAAARPRPAAGRPRARRHDPRADPGRAFERRAGADRVGRGQGRRPRRPDRRRPQRLGRGVAAVRPAAHHVVELHGRSPSRSPIDWPRSAGPAGRASPTRASRSTTAGRPATAGSRSAAGEERPGSVAGSAPRSRPTRLPLGGPPKGCDAGSRNSPTSGSRTPGAARSTLTTPIDHGSGRCPAGGSTLGSGTQGTASRRLSWAAGSSQRSP